MGGRPRWPIAVPLPRKSVATMSKSALELEREARIAANKARLAEIGLVQTVQAIATAQTEQARARRATKAANRAARKAAGAAPAGRVRRSERVAGLDAPNYNENARLLSLADPEGTGSRDRRLLRENVTEEIYGVAHLDALGSCQQEWELFVDGYDANGNRIYDKVNGQTCHQCRQKTLGKRTSCSGCESLTGVFCGDCLFMRYGEHVDEVNANPDWRCPMCRDLCNCSFHRSKRGWAPTGTLYRHAIAEGYKSVAHYLVLNNLTDEAKLVALEREMCPPELAADLRKEIAEAQKAKAAQPAPAAASGSDSEAAAQGVPQPAAAVQEQLLELEQEAEEAPAAAPSAAAGRRSARGGAAKGEAIEAAGNKASPKPSPRKRQVTLTLAGVRKSKASSGGAAGGKQQKAGAAAAAGLGSGKAGAKVAAPERRGLRSSARLRAVTA